MCVVKVAVDGLGVIPQGVETLEVRVSWWNGPKVLGAIQPARLIFGVAVQAGSESLRLLISQSAADDFVFHNKQYDVVMALSSPYRSVPDNLGEQILKSIPDATLAEIESNLGFKISEVQIELVGEFNEPTTQS